MSKAVRTIKKRAKAKTKAKQPMVTLSLAVAMLMPMAEAAQAQFAANCTRSLIYDTFAECGGGKITVTPNTGNVLTNGCVVVLGSPKQALCTAKNFATTGSINVQMTAKKINLTGPGVMQLKNFNIGTAAGGATKTYTSASLTATPLLFGIGGRLLVNGGQALGAYSGKVTVTVTFTP